MYIKKKLKSFLNPFRSKKRKQGSYISCEETVINAKKQGLSVTDYIEKIWDQKGNSAKVIGTLCDFGFFRNNTNVLEIGAGTGRYLDHVLKNQNIEKVFSYETAEDWSYYLEENYSPTLIRRQSDGYNLNFESDSSIDNVVAHGVFVYLPILHCFHYLKEIVRVIKNSGLIAFDIYDSENFNLDMINNWLDKGGHYYPVVIDKKLIIEFFEKQNINFKGEFNNPHGLSYSTYLIFQRNDK